MREATNTSVLLYLYVAAQKVGGVLDASLAGSRLSGDEAVILNQIEHLEPVTPSALAARIGTSPSTLSYRLRVLVDRGYLVRRPNPADGRSALLSLSARGRRAWHAAMPAWHAALHEIEAGLTVSEAVVAESLQSIAESAGAVVSRESRTRELRQGGAR